MMSTTQDSGAVYTFRDVTFRDNIIRYNLFMNMPNRTGGQHGIYLDGSYGQIIYGNLFYNCGAFTVFYNDGRENQTYDNISINTDNTNHTFLHYGPGPYAALTQQDRWDALISSDVGLVAYLTNAFNRPSEDHPNYDEWYSRWTEIFEYDLDPDYFMIDGEINEKSFFATINVVDNNKVFGGNAWSRKDMFDMFGIGNGCQEHELTDNPYFADPTHGDYTVVNTDAFEEVFPFDKVGRK